MSAGPKKPSDREGKIRDEHGTAIEPGAFRIERLLPGPIERIWTYLTDPKKRKKWFGAGPMELRAQGRVELRFRFSELTSERTPPGKDDSCEIPGRITQCDPPRLLSFTWGEGADASEVTFELTPRGKKVLLVITHRRLGDLDAMANVASGWHAHLGLLDDHLAGREPRPFWTTKLRLEQEYRDQLRERA
ncbi:MAG TPA: SRPBCC family protein [Stellaceae bacterium]|nr:SRPBCC family protein [Stellaceae bacterium]